MNRFELTLDLDKRGGVAQWVTLRQGDHNGTELRATIYDHGTQVGSGYTCRVSIRLPGEGNEYYRETATYTNGVAVVTVDEEYAAAIVGVTEGYFELLQGDAVIASTESFGVRILRSAQDGAVPGDKYDSAIEDALAELDEATGRISQMVVDATEEYLEAHPELTTTVEDNSLTDAKLIQHGGILDRVARLWHRLDNLLTATPAEADALTVTDAAKTPLAGLALYGRSTQDGTPTPSAPVDIVSVEPDASGNVSLWARGANLSPFFSVTPISSEGGYWTGVSSYWTPTSDGWARFTRSVTSATNTDIATYPQVGFEVGQTYTVLLEWRNVSLTGSAAMYMQADATRQLDAIASTTITAGSGRAYVQTTCLHSADETGITRFLYWRTRLQPDSSLDGEFRLSIYKGEYTGGYVPYAESTTPIDLQGHTLRSLPDGTRDEVSVDQYGHAMLAQRVGAMTLNGSESWGGATNRFVLNVANLKPAGANNVVANGYMSHYVAETDVQGWQGNVGFNFGPTNSQVFIAPGSEMHQAGAAAFKAWLAENPIDFIYPLATPVTIDLGTIDSVALQGPDMTAQSVPTAPFALTYERDLNTTLARLEAAIADAATA